MIYAPSKHPGLVEDVITALIPKVGLADYKPSIEGIRRRLRSATKADQQSTDQRSSPRFLRIIATRDEKRINMFKADSNGDVGVLRCERVEELFGDIMWDSAPSVQ